MANAWMPGAGRIPRTTPGGGLFQGGAPRAVWTTTESDPATRSARAAAQQLDREGRAAHLVWNPLTGEVVQLLPATAPALGQLGGDGPDRAAEGRVCLVIQVVGHALAPFTDAPFTGLDPVLRWLSSWDVPCRWPAGAPPASAGPQSPAAERHWARGGHFGHSQVPGTSANGPGAISPELVLGPLVPRPRREVVTALPTPVVTPPRENGARPYAEAAGR